MILPIRAYGDPVLRKACDEIDPQYPNLKTLLENMFETMDESNGVGLAAPQIGLNIRLFIIDSTAMYDNEKDGLRTVFINPIITEESGKAWAFEEGCLSIPNIRENVNREPKIKITYYDENFAKHQAEFNGMTARVIQHECDHIEGVLFIDHLSALKRKLMKGKLTDISKGNVSVDYRMRFPKR
ncbi:MAG: peptide deformylase [Bacteroidia bacterium]|jgi:peptide deformylase